MSGKPAARVSDPTACPIPGHGTNPIAAGSPDVLFDNLPAARQGDPTSCGSSLASAVIPNVLINGKPATTIGTVGSHGNVVIGGSGTVIIGTSGGGAAFIAPTAPFPRFDERFRVLTPDGEPCRNQRYLLLRESGEQEDGVTDEQGLTHLVAPHDKPERIEIYLAQGER